MHSRNVSLIMTHCVFCYTIYAISYKKKNSSVLKLVMMGAVVTIFTNRLLLSTIHRYKQLNTHTNTYKHTNTINTTSSYLLSPCSVKSHYLRSVRIKTHLVRGFK